MSGYSEKYRNYVKQKNKGIGIAFFNHGCGFTGDGEQTRDFTYVDSVVDANIKAALSGDQIGGMVFNIGNNVCPLI